MKMKPIIYEEVYDESTGFTPITTEKEHIPSRSVQLSFVPWANGYAMVVQVTEIVQTRPTNSGIIPRLFTRTLFTEWIYDDNNSQLIKPTAEQALLIRAMGMSELRGSYAESVAYSLYINLVVLKPEFGLEKWLPTVVAVARSMSKQFAKPS